MPFKDEESWELSYYSFLSETYHGAEGWDEVLSHRYVVILAEAGAGKTEEMRQKVQQLNSQKRGPAFYFTINSLAQTSLKEALLTSEDEVRFDAWLQSDEHAFFFADSLDEARINGHTMLQALSRLQKALTGGIGRASIFISSRVSDWRAVSDVADFYSFFPNLPSEPKQQEWSTQIDEDAALLDPIFGDRDETPDADREAQTTSSGLHIVALAPLTASQARALAAWDGVQQVDAFISAVRQADAMELANRPQDLLGLTALWRQTGQIGTKYEILKWSIDQRLREMNTDLQFVDTLSQREATEGAQLVAAAMTLGHKRFIAWPIEGKSPLPDSVSINPADVLPGLSAQQHKLLINRAIFDPASHGRVRIHHRSAQELLCAEWLLRLIKAGCPRRRVWALISENRYGKVRIRPSLRPVTAWLAQLDDRIRELVLTHAPEILIEGGDPKLLPIVVRKKLLVQFSETYANRDDAGISIDIQQLARLSDRQLVPTIRELWRNARNSGEVKELILRIIWIGRLNECADIALEAAQDISRPYLASVGARALSEIGALGEREILATFVTKSARRYPSQAIAPALNAVFPSAMTVSQLRDVILKYPQEKRRVIHAGLSHGLSEIARTPNLKEAPALASMFLELLKKGDSRRKGTAKKATNYDALRAPLLRLCVQFIKDADNMPIDGATAEAVRYVGCRTEYSQNYDISQAAKDLRAALEANQGANRQQFLLSMNDACGNAESRWKFQFERAFKEIWHIGENSFAWLLTDIEDSRQQTERLFLLNAIVGLWARSGKHAGQLEQIRHAIRDSHTLNVELESLLNPPAKQEEDWEREHRLKMIEIDARHSKQEKKAKESWIRLRAELQADPSKLASDRAWPFLVNISNWLHRACGYSADEQSNWKAMIPAFGCDVAEAARDSLVSFWRTYDPGFLSRRKRLTLGWEVGRVGVAIEAAQAEGWAKALATDEVVIATNYALPEIGDLPSYVIDLWLSRKKDVHDRICAEIRWEFGRSPKQAAGCRFQQIVRQCNPDLRKILSDWTYKELKRSEPRNVEALENALINVTQAADCSASDLASLAKRKTQSVRSYDRKILWLAVWIATDAVESIRFLDDWLKRISDQAGADKLVVDLLAASFDNHSYRFGSRFQDFRQVWSLTKLVRLAYCHIRREDDLVHNGVYTPGVRDRAEEARNILLGMLIDLPGEATFRALRELSQEAPFKLSSERFVVLADERATKDADLVPWGAADVIDFSDRYEREAKTLSDLDEIVADRLWDIQDTIESGRFFDKVTLRQDQLKRADERPVQLALAQQLETVRGTLYSLEREPEQSDYNEPDISVLSPAVPVPLPIEVKVADSWSYRQLTEAVEDQLVGKYMKPRGATCGHLVITFHNKKAFWKLGGKKLAFSDLISSLQSYADRFVSRNPDISRITVTGIDLS